jgi:DNA-binding NtrC family response regulator
LIVPRGRILLVDDDPADLSFYSVILEHEGYRLKTSASFADGVSLLERESYDMVVVSQGTLAFDGRYVLERAMQIDPQRPVAVITRCLDPACYLEAMNLGAVDYREKTVDRSEFVSMIEFHLGCGRKQTHQRTISS